MSDQQKLIARAMAVVSYCEQVAYSGDKEAIAVTVKELKRAIPLIPKANIFDPSRGLRLAWYQFAKACNIPEPE
jgi:hypothetical protein